MNEIERKKVGEKWKERKKERKSKRTKNQIIEIRLNQDEMNMALARVCIQIYQKRKIKLFEDQSLFSQVPIL